MTPPTPTGGRRWRVVVSNVERQLGHPLERTTGTERVIAVRLLEWEGAFELRHGVALTARALQVSRYTIYGDLRTCGSTGTDPRI